MPENKLPLPVGDGIHDDTEAIRAHMIAGKSIPKGTKGTHYVSSETIYIPPNIVFEYASISIITFNKGAKDGKLCQTQEKQ